MSLAKVFLLVFLLLLSSLSGCMFLRQTHFTLLSFVIDDDNGFPRFYMQFNTSDVAVVTLSDPQHTILFSDTYYKGIHNESIYLSGYRTTVDPGRIDYRRLIRQRTRFLKTSYSSTVQTSQFFPYLSIRGLRRQDLLLWQCT
jgi:hypothetical protein